MSRATVVALLVLGGCSAGDGQVAPAPAAPDTVTAVSDADALADAGVDAPADAAVDADADPDADADADADADVPSPPPPPPSAPPDAWGPYPVGTKAYTFFDPVRFRWLSTQVWYPSQPSGDKPTVYVGLIPGKAVTDADPDKTGAPWPTVLFSHGFKGINAQSVGFTEYIASHGYVVAATNHPGNTLFDFGSKDEDVAKASLERPKDVAFLLTALATLDPGDALSGLADLESVAVTGHSFGGWTALIVAGGSVDVDEAEAQCAAGAPSDIFCDYLPYFPAGQVIQLDPPMAGLKAAVVLAPGGYSSIGDAALAKIAVPTLVMGGTIDKTTPVPVEIDPIYNGLAAPRAEVVLEKADHMSYTNICAVPGAAAFIPDFCGDPTMLSGDEALPVAGAFAVAWLGYFVKGETGMLPYIQAMGAKAPVATFKSSGL